MASVAASIANILGGGVKRREDFELPDVTSEDFSLPEDGPFKQGGISRFFNRIGRGETDTALNRRFNQLILQERVKHLRDQANVSSTSKANTELELLRDRLESQQADVEFGRLGARTLAEQKGLPTNLGSSPEVGDAILKALLAEQGAAGAASGLAQAQDEASLLLAPEQAQQEQRTQIAKGFAEQRVGERATSEPAEEIASQQLLNQLGSLRDVEAVAGQRVTLPGIEGSIPFSILSQQPALANMLGRVTEDPTLRRRLAEADIGAKEASAAEKRQRLDIIEEALGTSKTKKDSKPNASEIITVGGQSFLRTTEGLVPFNR